MWKWSIALLVMHVRKFALTSVSCPDKVETRPSETDKGLLVVARDFQYGTMLLTITYRESLF